MAEIELNILLGQCLKKSFDDIAIVGGKCLACQENRNTMKKNQLAKYK